MDGEVRNSTPPRRIVCDRCCYYCLLRNVKGATRLRSPTGRYILSSKRSRAAKLPVTVALISLLVSALFFLSAFRYPLVYDAANYWHIATEFAAQGIFDDYSFSSLRTYGYPFVISLFLPME